MSLDNLSDINVGDLIVLIGNERRAVGFVTDYTSQEVMLALEDPKFIDEFYRKGNILQRAYRRAFSSPMGSLNMDSHTYNLHGYDEYQKLTPNETSGASENLVDKLSLVQTDDIILISNPQLRVVGFVDGRSSTDVTLRRQSGPGAPLSPYLKHDLRKFNHYEVLHSGHI